MAGSVTFYTYPLAFNPAKAKVALEEKHIKYTEKKIDIFSGQSLEPWYLKLNPNASAPTLVAGEQVITESMEIVKWVDQQGEPLGGDKVDRAFVSQWLPKVDAWDGNLFASAFGSAGPILKLTAEHKIKVAEAAIKRHPDLADIYRQKISSLKGSSSAKDKAEVDSNKAQLVALLDEAEVRLSKTKFLAGDEYTVADAIFTPCIYRIPQVKLDKELLDPRVHVKRYWGELKNRPSYKKAFGVSDSGLATAGTVLPALAHIALAKLTRRY